MDLLFPKTRAGRIRFFIIMGIFLLFQITLIGCVGFSMFMPGKSYKGPLPPLTGEETQIRDRLRAHVYKLAGEIGIRDQEDHPKALEAAAAYIRSELETQHYTVREHPFTVFRKTVKNLDIELKGTIRPDEILVVGAHYDSMWETPGADDNASGTAAILELARLLQGRPLARTVRLAAFVNEEPPYFQSPAMGSYAYAQACRQRKEDVIGMLSLEMLGYYSDAPHSQNYPYPFNLFFPNTGNFIGFVGNIHSRGLVRQAIGAFRRVAAFPSEGSAAPGQLTGVGWSDHWAFWQAGYPALMVTDTALFRNLNYHTAQDTPETLDYDRMARVTAGLARVVEDLAGAAEEPKP